MSTSKHETHNHVSEGAVLDITFAPEPQKLQRRRKSKALPNVLHNLLVSTRPFELTAPERSAYTQPCVSVPSDAQLGMSHMAAPLTQAA